MCQIETRRQCVPLKTFETDQDTGDGDVWRNGGKFVADRKERLSCFGELACHSRFVFSSLSFSRFSVHLLAEMRAGPLIKGELALQTKLWSGGNPLPYGRNRRQVPKPSAHRYSEPPFVTRNSSLSYPRPAGYELK